MKEFKPKTEVRVWLQIHFGLVFLDPEEN